MDEAKTTITDIDTHVKMEKEMDLGVKMDIDTGKTIYIET